MYPYLDTDIGSYAGLYEYVKCMSDDFGLTVRMSTVGYSRHNENLQRMHERIVKEFPHAIAGMKFSMTPYTYGWTSEGEESGECSRSDFNKDMANALGPTRP